MDDSLHQAPSCWSDDFSVNWKVFTLKRTLELIHPKVPRGAETVPRAAEDHGPPLYKAGLMSHLALLSCKAWLAEKGPK